MFHPYQSCAQNMSARNEAVEKQNNVGFIWNSAVLPYSSDSVKSMYSPKIYPANHDLKATNITLTIC